MSLRRRLYVAAAVLLTVIALAGVLLVRSVEATEIDQADQQLTSLLATPTLPLFAVMARGSAFAVRGFSIQQSRPPDGNSGAPVGNSGAANASSGPQQKRIGKVAGAKLPKYLGDFYVATVSGTKRHLVATPLDAVKQSPLMPRVSSGPLASSLQFVTVGSQQGSGSWRAVLIRVSSSQQELLALPLSSADATISRFRLATLAAGLLAVIALLAAGVWVYRLGLQPIAEVTEVADGITAGDRRRRVARMRPGTEAGHLARAFNVMLDEQQALEERLRQFVADVGHELRTPLSVIQGFAGLWRQGDLRNGEANEDAMRRIGQESARMARLVEDLLLLARLDEGRLVERAPVDLVSLVSEVIDDTASTHPSREIELEATGPVVVEGDAAALRRTIVNLISNAVNHTEAPARVAVLVSASLESVALEVRDSGPGMDPETVAHAFDRFWRADASRATPGSGLGLSIVAGIVAAHGGEIELTSDSLQGTTVRIVLPATQPGLEAVEGDVTSPS